MYGGTITGGQAKNGGCVRVYRPGHFVLDGGTVTAGQLSHISDGNGGAAFTVEGNATSASAIIRQIGEYFRHYVRNRYVFANCFYFILFYDRFDFSVLRFGITAPRTSHKAALEKDNRSYSRPIVNRKALNIKYSALYIAWHFVSLLRRFLLS
jgi:hypothetical protein